MQNNRTLAAAPAGPSAKRRALITILFVAALAVFLSDGKAKPQAVATTLPQISAISAQG